MRATSSDVAVRSEAPDPLRMEHESGPPGHRVRGRRLDHAREAIPDARRAAVPDALVRRLIGVSKPYRVSPVPTKPFRPFHAPTRRGAFGTRSRLPGAFRGLRPAGTGSAPLVPADAGQNDDAAGFA